MVGGVERTFYLVDGEHASVAYDRLTRIGAAVAPSNLDASRKQWSVDIGDHALAMQQSPRLDRLPASVPARTADDVARAQRASALDRAAFEVWQQHVQTSLEGQSHVYTRHLQLGLGPAGVLAQALHAPALTSASITDRLIVTRELTSVLETRGEQRIGQHRSAIDSPAIPVAEHALASEQGEFVTSDEFAGAMNRARARLQANVFVATAGHVQHRDGVEGGWEVASASQRVEVVSSSGHRMYIYADVIDQLTGPGTPRSDPLRGITDADTLAKAIENRDFVASADLEALQYLRADANILVVPGSPTSDWMAEAAARLGSRGHVHLVGGLAPDTLAKLQVKLQAALATGDKAAVDAVIGEIETAAHFGMQIPRNAALRDSFPEEKLSISTGTPTAITRGPDGKYHVTFQSLTGNETSVGLYDQIFYAYGQDKTHELKAQFGEGANVKEDGEVPSTSVSFEMVTHAGIYIGLKAVGLSYFIPGPVASPSYTPWVRKQDRATWSTAVRGMAAAGSSTRDHGPVNVDSHGVSDGLEMQRDRLHLAAEHRALGSYELPGLDVTLRLGADASQWQAQLTAFFRSQLPATPADKVEVTRRNDVAPGETARFEVFTAGHSLGVIKLYADDRLVKAERKIYQALSKADLMSMTFEGPRGEMGLDGMSGQASALLTGSLGGKRAEQLGLKENMSGADRETKLRQAATLFARALAELHLKTRSHETVQQAREARRADAEAEIAALWMNPAVIYNAGGPGRLASIEKALRAHLLPAYISSEAPRSRTHGRARFDSFAVGVNEKGDPAARTTNLETSREKGDPSRDVVEFLATISDDPGLSDAERAVIRTEFVRAYDTSFAYESSAPRDAATAAWHEVIAALSRRNPVLEGRALESMLHLPEGSL